MSIRRTNRWQLRGLTLGAAAVLSVIAVPASQAQGMGALPLTFKRVAHASQIV